MIVYFSQRKSNIRILLLTKCHNLFGFHWFSPMSFSYFQVPSRMLQCIYLPHPLSLFDLRQFFTLSLFSMMLAVLRSAGHTVCRMFLSLHLPDFCSWVLGRKNALSPHQIRFTFYRHDFLLVMLVLLTCPRQCLPIHPMLLFLLFHTLPFRSKSLNTAHPH